MQNHSVLGEKLPRRKLNHPKHLVRSACRCSVCCGGLSNVTAGGRCTCLDVEETKDQLSHSAHLPGQRSLPHQVGQGQQRPQVSYQLRGSVGGVIVHGTSSTDACVEVGTQRGESVCNCSSLVAIRLQSQCANWGQ